MDRYAKYLILGGTPFFIQTSLEMYLFTLTNGPQMLFYSIAHGFPFLLLIVLLSGIAFVSSILYTSVIICTRLLGRLPGRGQPVSSMAVILVFQIAHLFLLLTYDYWSTAFKN